MPEPENISQVNPPPWAILASFCGVLEGGGVAHDLFIGSEGYLQSGL